MRAGHFGMGANLKFVEFFKFPEKNKGL